MLIHPTFLPSVCTITQPLQHEALFWWFSHHFSASRSGQRSTSSPISTTPTTPTLSISPSLFSPRPSNSPPPLPGQVSRGLESRTEYYLSFWLATARELFDCILTKDKFTKHDAITAPSLMPLITFTTMASSLRPRVHFLSSLSTLLPSSTWQTWEHPLPFQWLQPWRCHRWFWHASPHPFPTLDPPFLREKLLHSPNDKIIFLSATHPPKSSKTPATKTPPTSGSWVWSLPHAYTNKTQTHFSLSLHIPIQTSRGIRMSNQSSAKACALGATIIDASQWLTIDYESSLMQGLMTCTWGLMTDHYSAQKQ